MTPTAPPSTRPHDAAPITRAGLFLRHLGTGDFSGLRDAIEPDTTMQALLPRGFAEWEGADAVCGAFEQFFGGMDGYELVDATAGHVGDRLRLSWRLRVSGGRLGSGVHLVEQHCYADTGATGRLRSIALVCSGFRLERPSGGDPR